MVNVWWIEVGIARSMDIQEVVRRVIRPRSVLDMFICLVARTSVVRIAFIKNLSMVAEQSDIIVKSNVHVCTTNGLTSTVDSLKDWLKAFLTCQTTLEKLN